MRFFSRYLAARYASKHAHMAKNDHGPCDGTTHDEFAKHGILLKLLLGERSVK